MLGCMTTPTVDIETFRKLFRDWDDALAANDADRIAEFATPDWIFVSQDGVLAGREFLTAVANGSVSHDTMCSEVITARPVGDVAVVVTRVVNTGAFQGVRFENDEWTSDVFVHEAGRWRCELTHLTSRRR
jgi:uncharacterized protein (TIGR02246 family)